MEWIWKWTVAMTLGAAGVSLLVQVILGHSVGSILWRTSLVILVVGWVGVFGLTAAGRWIQARSSGAKSGTPEA